MSTPGPGANAGQLAWAQNDTVPPDASSTWAKHRKPAAARPRAAGAHGQPVSGGRDHALSSQERQQERQYRWCGPAAAAVLADRHWAWSRLIQSYDGFLFVFPQYNWGYPAVIKNALDYLYQEWHDKPASFLTYRTRGGNKAADQFTSVMHGLHMRVMDDHVEAVITEHPLLA